MMNISIRPITQADIGELVHIARRTFYDTFTGTCSEKDMEGFLDKFYNPQRLKAELATPGNHFYFAEADGQTAGYLQFMEDYSGFPMMKKWKALELKRIYILTTYQGMGVAQRLMDHYLEYAKAHQYEVAWLGVWEHNTKAQRFYEKYGFANSGHTHDFPIGDTPQTDYWFWKFL